MCVGGAPKIPAPAPIADRVSERPPALTATSANSDDAVARRAGYAGMILTNPTGLGQPSTTMKTLLGAPASGA